MTLMELSPHDLDSALRCIEILSRRVASLVNEKNKLRDEAIEECARAIERHFADDPRLATPAAAAIRALKD